MPTPFITEADVVDYLGRGDAADPGITIAVGSACDIVRALTEQAFNQVIGGTAVLDGTGTDALLLPQLPVTAAGTVTVNGDAVTDYTLSSNGILYRGGSIGDACSSAWPSGRQNITVTYDHGYADDEVPLDVCMVALAIAARLVVQGPLKSETIGQVSATYAVAATDLTVGEKAILSKYRVTR